MTRQIQPGDSVYGARPIKRERRTKERVAQLDRQILEVLTADHPQSVRHVYYRMTDPRLPEPVEKTEKGYKAVQRRCVELRRVGRLPYNWLSDTGRRGYFVNTFSGASDFVRSMASLYRADLWERADYKCEVWCESRSIAGVIQADCEELAVSLYPAGGFSSITFAFEAAYPSPGRAVTWLQRGIRCSVRYTTPVDTFAVSAMPHGTR